MGEPHTHFSKDKIPEPKGYMLYGYTHKLFQKSKANWEKQIADGGRLAGAGLGGLFTPPSAPGQPLMVRCHKPSLLELSDQVLEGSRI